MDWKRYIRPGTLIGGLAIFITLLVDGLNAATVLASMIPWISAFLPLIAVGGTAFFGTLLTGSCISGFIDFSQQIRADLEERESEAKREALLMIDTLRSRFREDGRFETDYFVTSNDESQKEDNRILMRELTNRGLGPQKNSTTREWYEHLSRLEPYVKRYGVERTIKRDY